MATDAELQLIIRARDEASSTLNKVQVGLAGVGKVAGDLQKKVFGGEFFKSILGGVGLGSGAQITQLLVDTITKPWKEAADYAKSMESMSEKWLGHQREMLDIRRQILGIAKEENLVDLERRAREANAAFAAANNATVTSSYSSNPYGLGPKNNFVTSAAPDSPERAAQLARLQQQVIEAEQAVARAKLKAKTDEKAAQDRDTADVLANVRKASAGVRLQIEIEQKRDDQRRRVNASIAAEDEQRAATLVKVEDALTDFFDAVEKGAAELASKKSALEQLRDRTQNNPNALSVGQGVEFGALSFIDQVGSRGEQVAQTLSSTLGNAVYSISDGIYGWVTGIGSATEAAYAFLQGALRSVIDMIVRIGLQQIINATIGRSVAAATAAATIAIAAPQAVAMAGIWAAPATLATIASYGAAAAQAPFSIAAAKGAVLASSLAGFAGGGLVSGPGTGTSDSILARISNGEYIVPAAAVQRIGESNLDAMSYGGLSASTAMIPASGGSGGGRGATVLVDNRREADRFRRGSPMETQIVQVVQANRYRIAT